MQEIDMSSTTTVSTNVENESVDNLPDEVGLNNNISDNSINGSKDSSTDSNNSSNRSTPSSNVSLRDTTPPINEKPKDDDEGEDKDTQSVHNVSGGQLKFFKDGMLCLQLAHQNAGKSSKWVQIRTRTVFPSLVHVSKEVSIPCQLSPAPNSFSGIPSRVENSSTSRSVSDDGSSILSSPTLRESSWKQQVPRKGASNILLQFFMTPATCITRRRKVLYHKFPRLTRQPYNLSWIKKFASCTTTTTFPTAQLQTNEIGPTECLECTTQHPKEIQSSSEENSVDGGGSQDKKVYKKTKLNSCISRLSVRVEKCRSTLPVNSNSELIVNVGNSGDVQHNADSNKTPIKNIRVTSIPSGNCRDLKNNSNSSAFVIRPKVTEKRSKMIEKDKATILSVPSTTAKLTHRHKIDHHLNNVPIDFSKMAESSSSSSSSPSIHHQQNDRRNVKEGGKSKKFKKEKLADQRQKLVMSSSPQKSHSSSTDNQERKNLQGMSESTALNLSSSNRQCLTSSDINPFNLSLPNFANHLYPINYLSVLAASSTSNPSTLNSAANYPNYSSASSVGLNLQQQLLQQHAMSSVISDTVNCLLAANKVTNSSNSSGSSSSDRTRRDPHMDNKSGHHLLNLVQDSSNSISKKMQHKSKMKKSSNANFKVPVNATSTSSSFSSNAKSSPNKLLYFGNNSGSSSCSSSAQNLLETSSSSSPLSRNNLHSLDTKQNSFLRNLLDTSYPIPSNKLEGREILKSNLASQVKSHHHSKTKGNAEEIGNVRAKSHQNVNTKLKSNIINHSVSPFLHVPISHSKSSSLKSSSKLSSKSMLSDRDKGKERSSSLNNPTATNFLSQLSSQRSSSSDLARLRQDPMDILRGSTSSNATAAAAAAFHNSLLGHPGMDMLSGFPGTSQAVSAVAAAAAAYFKNPPKNDYSSLLSGMPSFDYASAFNSSQKNPWNTFPVMTNLFDGGGIGSSLSSSTSISSDSTKSKYNDNGSDAPLNLCKKSRPH